ncbi:MULTISPECIES: hypothetical protein [Cetobacterium]|uniref:UspA domain-containing protein n=1 Tax=Candidatus Cetobacterium colombiensis TaxID=3073100 RepID=A0ABU4WAM3_9FUSO|nr:hypothetical protein [Candidatus Cetobacterium colombiensis]MDX8336067.1 hypothetical protein [Candidatus Cetobacterium colombiensis]
MEKILILFKYYNDSKLAIENYKSLKKNFNFEILPLYIKELKAPTGVTFLSPSMTMDILKEYEDEYIEDLKKLLLKEGITETLNLEIGVTKEIVQEYLKKVDCLMVEETGFLDEEFLAILKVAYKPIIVINKSVSKFKDVAIVSDDGIKINKSVNNFIRDFPQIKNVTLLTWNYKSEENHLLDFLERKGIEAKVEMYTQQFNTKDEFIERMNEFDLIVMGNLSKSFFFEKITKRMGIEIIEKAKSPIFIG